jgi:hypothetical protein
VPSVTRLRAAELLADADAIRTVDIQQHMATVMARDRPRAPC